MKTIIKIIPFLCIIFISTIPAVAQDAKDPFATETVAEEKVKTEKSDSFFAMEIDKLSEKFFMRMLINLISVFLLIRGIYYYNYRKKEMFFTYFIFNFVIFLIAFFLNKVDMGIGAAFGLFAVFAMLRYRTENISAKDMTYLFLVIAIGLITAISKVSAVELGILNGLALFLTFMLESGIFLKKESSKLVQYENIDMIKRENFPDLILDLKKRTGLNIHRVELDKVDFLKDTALLKLFYYDEKQKPPVKGTPN